MMNIETQEVKTLVAQRFPPGDRWIPLSNSTVVLDSLTQCMEYIYREIGKTQFFVDAREGSIYTVDTKLIEIPEVLIKEWSLYGE